MSESLKIAPPIFVRKPSGIAFALSSVSDVIDYVRRNDPEGEDWAKLREAAFIAAAVPSPENVETVRALTVKAFGPEIWS